MMRLVVSLVVLACAVNAQTSFARVSAGQAVTVNADLLFEQGRRAFEQFQYDQAVPLFDRIVGALTAAPGQRPDLLVQTLEMRARARFALGDTQGAEQDFGSLLQINPSFKLGSGISPRVVAVFEGVRKVTVGQVMASMAPAGDAELDGKPMKFADTPTAMDMTVGEHTVVVKRQGYRPVTQKFVVAPGTSTPLEIVLERVSATLTVMSIPEGAEVVIDGTSRGVTARGDTTTGPSAPLVVGDLTTGTHRLILKRACFQDAERTITIEKPDDLQIDPMRLSPAVATVRIQAAGQAGTVFLDGVSQGTVPTQINNLCVGQHVIEVRGPRGRFVDRRDWKTGETATLVAELRSAFAIVATRAAQGSVTPQTSTTLERALGPARRVLVFAPSDAELEAAYRGETVPPNWLTPAAPGASAPTARPPKEVVKELGRRVATKLNAQGLAAVAVGTDPYQVSVALLAAGSGEPDVITINLADPASVTRALDRLGAPLPPMMRPSLESSVVDLAGGQGAVVVRAGGAGAKAGLAVGDVIVGAGGSPVVSVADLRAKLAALKPPALDLPLEVKGGTGTTRTVNGAVVLVPDTLPMGDTAISYNRALAEVEDAIRLASNPNDTAAARLNLAIVQMRLGNYDVAETELRSVQLPDGPGVSAGTVAYLSGLCLEALGRTADARTAFTRAAASTQARVSYDGPLVAPLAQQKLSR